MPNDVRLTLRLPNDLKNQLNELAKLKEINRSRLIKEILQNYLLQPEHCASLDLQEKYQTLLQRKKENTKQIDIKFEEDRLVREDAIRELKDLSEFQKERLRIRIMNCIKQHKIPMTESEIAYEIEEDPDLVLGICSLLERSNKIRQDSFLKFFII